MKFNIAQENEKYLQKFPQPHEIISLTPLAQHNTKAAIPVIYVTLGSLSSADQKNQVFQVICNQIKQKRLILKKFSRAIPYIPHLNMTSLVSFRRPTKSKNRCRSKIFLCISIKIYIQIHKRIHVRIENKSGQKTSWKKKLK